MYAKEFLSVGIFLAIGVVFVAVTLIASWAIRPTKPNDVKGEPYECGEEVKLPAWVRFRVGYYLYALIFLVFDVEVAFVYPWAAVLRSLTKPAAIVAIVDMFIFIAILAVGLAYAWRKGVLEWK
ncbi:MAG: NADH-quinone oxidoreductase subunit A [Abditibacteriota bacterium]|nr:NADH-quinone oxidoreductase subunit A [Abditibacteriota bacterium]MBP5738717.1 NADH-quinone oxidoreductase subunit A [Abditibacteriota bacterium]